MPAVIASWKGRTFNTSAISRQLGVSRPTVVAYVRALQAEGVARLLPHYGSGRRPRFSTPQADAIITRILRFLPECRFFWWKTGSARVLELVADTGNDRVGFCFSSWPLFKRREWLPLEFAARQRVINYGYVIDTGPRACFADAHARVLPWDVFMDNAEKWILHCRTGGEALEEMVRVNLERLQAEQRMDKMRPWNR